VRAIAANPPTPIGVIARFRATADHHVRLATLDQFYESPAWALEEQAVQVAEVGPFAPQRIETNPDARFTIAAGLKKGEILRGPPLQKRPYARGSMTSNPPIPDPM